MARYIDADKAYKIARTEHKDFAQSMADLTSLREVLEDTPSADVVEVVRCKDCIFAEQYHEKYICNNTMSPWFNDDMNVYMEADDFCSQGKRTPKESEDTDAVR